MRRGSGSIPCPVDGPHHKITVGDVAPFYMDGRLPPVKAGKSTSNSLRVNPVNATHLRRLRLNLP